MQKDVHAPNFLLLLLRQTNATLVLVPAGRACSPPGRHRATGVPSQPAAGSLLYEARYSSRKGASAEFSSIDVAHETDTTNWRIQLFHPG